MEKRKSAPCYETFTPVEESTNLGKLINIVFRKLTTSRMLCSPVFYGHHTITEKKVTLAQNFYELCLGELYLHSMLRELHRWQDVLREYKEEFRGRWRYYAASKRLESINKHGGEHCDYCEDGTVEVEVGDDRLEAYSVIQDLVNKDWRDIFTRTKPNDLVPLCKCMIASESVNILDACEKHFGKRLPSYTLKNDGTAVKNTFADEVFHHIERVDTAKQAANLLMGAVVDACAVVDFVKALPKREDNKEVLGKTIPNAIRTVLEVNLKPVKVF
jgi:hypothetical protein